MKYISEWAKGDSQDPPLFLHFEKFNDLCGDFIFIAGYFDFTKLDTIPKDKKIVYLELEEPNRFFTKNNGFDRIQYEKKFFKVLSICPYTTKWINERDHTNSQQSVFFPFNEEFLPKVLDNKPYDINYSGNINSSEISMQINSMVKHNYRLISRSPDPRVTDRDTSYTEKLKIISESKISLVHNLLYLKKKHVRCLKSIPHAEKNFAFKNVFRKNIFQKFTSLLSNPLVTVPQIKTRTIEAAFCKSLILCLKDDFNIIENFFEPGKEFIYYEPHNLEEKICDILNNYEKYHPIVENAYKRAMNEYTTKHFAERYLMNII